MKRGRFDRFSPILYFNLLYLGERITSQSLKGQTDAFAYCYIVSSWNLLTERHSKIRSRVIKLFCLSIHRMCPNHSFFEYELTGRLCICENPSQSYGDYMYMHVFGCFKQGRTCVCVIVFQRGHPEEKVDSWILKKEKENQRRLTKSQNSNPCESSTRSASNKISLNVHFLKLWDGGGGGG